MFVQFKINHIFYWLKTWTLKICLKKSLEYLLYLKEMQLQQCTVYILVLIHSLLCDKYFILKNDYALRIAHAVLL